jgi:hypothetical protein
MIPNDVLSQFSQNRLNGEPVPDDLMILLPHRDELAERTGIRLEWAEDWAPWMNPGRLCETEPPHDPDRTAKLRATAEVCRLIAFVAADSEGQFFGYWRGPAHRPICDSPLVFLDKLGQFHLCAASSFAEAILAREYGHQGFAKLRAWLRALGIRIGWDSPSILTYPYEKPSPKDLYKELYQHYRTDLLGQD